MDNEAVMAEQQRQIQQSLLRLKKITARATPASGFTQDHIVFRRLAAPQNLGHGWVKQQKQEKYEAKHKRLLADTAEIVELVGNQLTNEEKSAGMENEIMSVEPQKFTLRNKLRDHVKEIFITGVKPKDSNTTQNRSTFVYNEEMQLATQSASQEHGLKKDQYSVWSEQCARAKAIGISSRK